MADAQLRYGLRILYSGGTSSLEISELSRLYHVCKDAIDERIHQMLDLSKLYSDINTKCVGAVVRLKRAYAQKYGGEITCSQDLAKVCPKALLSVEGFGEGSLLAYKRALDAQLKPLNLPLPTLWERSPSWHLDSRWC